MAEPETPTALPQLDLAAAGRLVGALRDDDDPSEGPEGEPAGVHLPRFGGYAAHHRIASGGGGVVYEATSPAGARVAVKLLAPLPDDPGGRARRRAWRELDLLAQLRLPSLPRVLDYGVHEGRIYIVTELVDGRPLDRHCTESGLDRRARVALLARVADAVHSLHEHGVIHRDIKPANILVDASGAPFLLDLGIAALLAGGPAAAATISADGAPIGTPAFMPPEQARGDRASLSTRSDVYALGATACLVLTGQTLHDTASAASLADAIRLVAHDPPRPPQALDPALPDPLAAVIAKAADTDPARRYESAAALAADLRRWMNGETVEAQPPTRARRVAGRIARHPVLATAALCVVIAGASTVLTLLSIRALRNAPYAVVVDGDTQSRVDLVSLGGRAVATWEAGRQGGVRAATYLRAHPLVGTDLVVIAWDRGAERAERGLLSVYDPSNPDVALWSAGAGGADLRLPSPAPDPYPDDFQVAGFIHEDVFPGRAGEEIIALHMHHPMSPTCLRVYDVGGEVLYEVWHDGQVGSLYWMSGPGLIVGAGPNCDRRWIELGFPEASATWPLAVFALHPRAGERLGFIRTPHGIGDADPAWYRFVAPYEIAAALQILPRSGVREPTPSLDDGRHVRIELVGLRDGGPGLALVLDQTGRIVDRYISDAYGPSGLPPAGTVTLEDAPPRREPAGPRR